MNTDTMYAPKTPDSVMRTAALFGAKSFGTEAVQVNPCAGGPEDGDWYVLVSEVTAERWPSGCPKLGRDMTLCVNEDTLWCTVADD